MKQLYRMCVAMGVLVVLGAPACVRSAESPAPAPGAPGKGKVGTPRAGAGTDVAPTPALPSWKEAGGYDLYVAGTEDPAARVFQSPDYQKLLVVPADGDFVYLLTLKSKTLEMQPRASVSLSAEGAVLASDRGAPSGAFTQQAADLHFKSPLGDLRLAPEPPLVGALTLETLLARKPEYGALARQYTPNGAALSLIRADKRPLEILVFFGTWCSYCKKWLPRFIRTIQEAKNPGITVRYFGVDEDHSQPEAELTKYGIRKTPTFVVLSGGTEIGRITEEPTKSMEQDLSLILFSGGK